jgi:F420H(2)-dependent quinone reductase
MNVLSRTFNAIGGQLMARSGRVGILATTGRRTGRRRTAPLGFVARPDGTVLVAAGSPGPAWAANLLAQPSCTFATRGRERRYRARLLEDREREEALVAVRVAWGRMADRATFGETFALEPEG